MAWLAVVLGVLLVAILVFEERSRLSLRNEMAALRDSVLHASRRTDAAEATMGRLQAAISQLPEGVVTNRRRLEAVGGDIVANVSHELMTPVGALTLLAVTLAADEDMEVTRLLAERILAEGQRLARIIEYLLDLSRFEWEESHNHGP